MLEDFLDSLDNDEEDPVLSEQEVADKHRARLQLKDTLRKEDVLRSKKSAKCLTGIGRSMYGTFSLVSIYGV